MLVGHDVNDSGRNFTEPSLDSPKLSLRALEEESDPDNQALRAAVQIQHGDVAAALDTLLFRRDLIRQVDRLRLPGTSPSQPHRRSTTCVPLGGRSLALVADGSTVQVSVSPLILRSFESAF